MKWKRIYRKDIKVEQKCCLNCKHATEEFLHQQYGICIRGRRRIKGDFLSENYVALICWEANDGSTPCNEEK